MACMAVQKLHAVAPAAQHGKESLEVPVVLFQYGEGGKPYRRVPKFWTYGSVCCTYAQRPDLLAHAEVTTTELK